MPPTTCCECDAKTWIIWDAKPWCRNHFHTAQERADLDRAVRADDAPVVLVDQRQLRSSVDAIQQ